MVVACKIKEILTRAGYMLPQRVYGPTLDCVMMGLRSLARIA